MVGRQVCLSMTPLQMACSDIGRSHTTLRGFQSLLVGADGGCLGFGATPHRWVRSLGGSEACSAHLGWRIMAGLYLRYPTCMLGRVWLKLRKRKEKKGGPLLAASGQPAWSRAWKNGPASRENDRLLLPYRDEVGETAARKEHSWLRGRSLKPGSISDRIITVMISVAPCSRISLKLGSSGRAEARLGGPRPAGWRRGTREWDVLRPHPTRGGGGS